MDDVLRPATSLKLKQEHPAVRMPPESPLRKAERNSKRNNHRLEHDEDHDSNEIRSQADRALFPLNTQAQAPYKRSHVSRDFGIHEHRVGGP